MLSFGVSDYWVKETVVTVVLFQKLHNCWDLGIFSDHYKCSSQGYPALCTMILITWNGSDKIWDWLVLTISSHFPKARYLVCFVTCSLASWFADLNDEPCSPTCFYQKVLKIIVVAQENVADGHKPSAAGLVSFFAFEVSSWWHFKWF